jgi:hypothetical protein
VTVADVDPDVTVILPALVAPVFGLAVALINEPDGFAPDGTVNQVGTVEVTVQVTKLAVETVNGITPPAPSNAK